MRTVRLAVAAVALGVTSVAVGYGWRQPLLWVPDLVVGLVWCGSGLRYWSSRPMAAALAFAVGTTWFLSSFVPATVFWHRGLLIHLLLVLAFASRSRLLIGTVALVYLCSRTPLVWHGEGMTIALACVLLLVIVAGLGSRPGRTSPGPRRTVLSRRDLPGTDRQC